MAKRTTHEHAADTDQRRDDRPRDPETEKLVYQPPIVGLRVSSSRTRYTHWCMFCGHFYPGDAVLDRYQLCLHCAKFDLQTSMLAIQQASRAGILQIAPHMWGAVVDDNAGRSCLQCGRPDEQRGLLSSTLGVEHLCIACVLHAAKTQATPQQLRPDARTTNRGGRPRSSARAEAVRLYGRIINHWQTSGAHDRFTAAYVQTQLEHKYNVSITPRTLDRAIAESGLPAPAQVDQDQR